MAAKPVQVELFKITVQLVKGTASKFQYAIEASKDWYSLVSDYRRSPSGNSAAVVNFLHEMLDKVRTVYTTESGERRIMICVEDEKTILGDKSCVDIVLGTEQLAARASEAKKQARALITEALRKLRDQMDEYDQPDLREQLDTMMSDARALIASARKLRQQLDKYNNVDELRQQLDQVLAVLPSKSAT